MVSDLFELTLLAAFFVLGSIGGYKIDAREALEDTFMFIVEYILFVSIYVYVVTFVAAWLFTWVFGPIHGALEVLRAGFLFGIAIRLFSED